MVCSGRVATPKHTLPQVPLVYAPLSPLVCTRGRRDRPVARWRKPGRAGSASSRQNLILNRLPPSVTVPSLVKDIERTE